MLLRASGKRKAQFRRKELPAGFELTPSQLVPRLQQLLVSHPHISGEGAQLDLIPWQTPAWACHALGLPQFSVEQHSHHQLPLCAPCSQTLTKHWSSPLLTPFCRDPLFGHSQHEVTGYPPHHDEVISTSP